jgi:hypothetical protein
MDVLKTPAGRQGLRLAFFVSGIVCSLLVYGVLQERIMTQVRLARRLSHALRRSCGLRVRAAGRVGSGSTAPPRGSRGRGAQAAQTASGSPL